jgi:ribosomal protein S18 acetylase RimI-like enzyme
MRLIELGATPLAILCDAFDRAFADYAVGFGPSAGFLGELMRRRGVRLDLSVGVEDGGELVAFTLNGLGRWHGEPTGYDAGTGVVPGHRGRRLTALMLARTAEVLAAAGATRYLLEVLRSNERAIRAYAGAGFEPTRELGCWRLDAVAGPPPGLAVSEEAAFEPAVLAAMRDVEPSWQNGDPAIARAGAPRVTLAVRDGAGPIGCAVLFPAAGDLAQLAVAPRARRRGVGRALLFAARARSARPLSILNVDAGDPGIAAFLAAAGAAATVRQLEMIRPLG